MTSRLRRTRSTGRPAVDRRWRRALLPAAAGLLALGLGACGSEPAPTAAAPSTTTVTETASPPAPTTTEAEPAPSSTSEPAVTAGPMPTGAVPYADALVIAWGSGERDEALRYATAEVVDTLFSAHSPGGPHWDQVSTEGAAGTIYVTYQDTETRQKLVIGVQNEASSKGTEHAVTKADFPG